MDYEKEYKSLVAKVKKAHQFAQTDSTKSVLEDILPQLSETEDENLRRSLVEYFKTFKPQDMWDERFSIGDVLTYIEKQKEQKPAEVNEYEIIKKHITEDSLSSEVNKRLTECGWYVTDEKSAEWSEEDKRALNDAIVSLSECAYGKIPHILPSMLLETVERLKSIRPSWKPSEEQMDALESCFYEFGEGYPDEDGLRSLYNDLKKL